MTNKAVTHKQRVLELLRDGRPHTHHELYRLGCVAHSRVADLRRDGHRIECRLEMVAGERVSVYRLLDEAAGSFPSPAVSSSSAAPATRSLLVDADCVVACPGDESALLTYDQLTLAGCLA